MKQIVFILIIFNQIVSYTFCAIRYVTPTGAGALNASSWANASSGLNLQSVINGATAGDEIWVAAGTYFTTNGTNRTISFSMRNNITIYGSFTGTETGLSQRNIAQGITSILSAEIGASGNSDNSFHTISNVGLNNSAIIDGFVIRGANDNRTATITEGLGGGIYNNGSGVTGVCSPTIRNCLITSNYATFGGGIFNNGYNGGTANPYILNCVITNNEATGGGGIDNFGLLNNGNASPTITNCVIYNNRATFRAGGMYCWGGNGGNTNPIVTNTTFVNNTAADGGGVVADILNLSGGSSGNSNPNFRNCIFWGNTATNLGPQFFLLGGATFTATYTAIDLTGQSSPHLLSGMGTGNLNINPLLSDASLGAGADNVWLTHDDGMNITINSPLINAGDPSITAPTSDIFGYIRTGIFDIGAYECRRYKFIGPGNLWSDNTNWDVGAPPPSLFQGAIIIEANCEKEGTLLTGQSQLIINAGKTLIVKE